MNNLNGLEEKIEKIAKMIPFAKLEKAAAELSLSYRAQTDGKKGNQPFMVRQEHKTAYLALRMPATYAAISEVLKTIKTPIHTLLDVGSGPGTVFWAVKNQCPELKEADLIEKDADMIHLSKMLLEGLKGPQISYHAQDIQNYLPAKTFDLVTAAYSLSELSEKTLNDVLSKLWNATDRYFCIIEPGTPYGFKTLLQTRDFLIAHKAFILAPCTHEKACPMRQGDDWCHFSTRFERTALQKRVKGGTLGYEDEKYCFLLACKEPLPRPESRIVKTPIKRSGFIQLTLCNQAGLQQKVFSKKDGDAYQMAKKLEWGDFLETKNQMSLEKCNTKTQWHEETKSEDLIVS